MKKIMLLAMIASSAVFARELIVTPVVGVNYSFLSAKSINSAVLGREDFKFTSGTTVDKDNFNTLLTQRLAALQKDLLAKFPATNADDANFTTDQAAEMNKILNEYGTAPSKAVSSSDKLSTYITYGSSDGNKIESIKNLKFDLPSNDGALSATDNKGVIAFLKDCGIDVTAGTTKLSDIADQFEKLAKVPIKVVADKDDAKKDSINSFGAKIGLEVKTPVYEQDKVRFLVGGAVSGNFAFTGNETIGTYTSLFVAPVAEVEYKVNDDMSVFGNVQPGIGVGLFKNGKNLAFNLDGTLGVKYDSFRVGVNGGARFLKGEKGMVTNGYIGATVGYDISFDLGE